MPERELLEKIRKVHPDATEREAWLLNRLISAYGMIRTLEGSYKISGADAYESFNEWMAENYDGWKVQWRTNA